MRHNNVFITTAAALMGISFLLGCGGSKETSKDDVPSSETDHVGDSSLPAPQASPQSAVANDTESDLLVVHDSTADEALETYLNGFRAGSLDVSISVLVPSTVGAAELIKMKEGWDRAAAEGAPIEMAKAVFAGEIDALKYEKISDDGAFATFRFTKPTSDTPYEIQVIKTPEGWRVQPPDTGLPLGE